MREKWDGKTAGDISEMKSLQRRGSCCNSGNESRMGVQRWGLNQPPWEKDRVERMRSWNNVDSSQRTYLNLGIVNTQGSVWGLIRFISDMDGGWDEPVQQYTLGTNDWLPVRRTWGLWWMSSGKWSPNVLSLPIEWTTYCATLGGTEQSSQGVYYPSPPGAGGAAPGIGCPNSGPADRKMLGNWKGFPWRTTKMFWDLEHMFWDLWGEVEETGYFCSAERRLRGNLIAAATTWRAVSKAIEPNSS